MNIRVIGIGNEFRGDDGVGIDVAKQLRSRQLLGIDVLIENRDGVALMEKWQNSDMVILIDAVVSGSKPGTIHRFDAQQQSIPTKFFHHSTHAFALAEAVELSRAMNQLPARLVVYGIEGKHFEAGVEISQEVRSAASHLVDTIDGELQLFAGMY